MSLDNPKEEDKERDEMIKTLHQDNAWQKWADGYISCPICGTLIHPIYRGVHEAWHERNNQ